MAPPSAAQRDRAVPDLFGLWLTGELANEADDRVDHRAARGAGRRWARRSDRPARAPGAAVRRRGRDPGRKLGPVLAGTARPGSRHRGPISSPRTTPPRAFAGTPLHGPDAAVLSSGTWSLLGVEISEPLLGADAARFNLTNERGVEGTIRLLRNVMGLWLLQESRRAWSAAARASTTTSSTRLAGAAPAEVPLFDPDHPSLLRGGDVPALIAARAPPPGRPSRPDPDELVRSILVSLACKYRLVLEQLQPVTGRRITLSTWSAAGAATRCCASSPPMSSAGRCWPDRRRRPRSATCSSRLDRVASSIDAGEMRELSGRSVRARAVRAPRRPAATRSTNASCRLTGRGRRR